jgi:spoIIIJ-associated protein
MNKQQIKTIEDTATELLKQIGIKSEVKTSEQEGVVSVQVETQETGMLIGYHGETLNALQLMTSLITYKKLGEWPKLVVEIGDYRQKRQEALSGMALSAADQAKQTGQLQHLPPMPAFERRVIHLALANDPEIATYSEGERDRHVVIGLKAKE